jgi:hypothetical protein
MLSAEDDVHDTVGPRLAAAGADLNRIELIGTKVLPTFPANCADLKHSDVRTLPRTPEEVDKQRADADRERERARRRYQGGMVLINDPGNFGRYMDLLVRECERREAVERGELPPSLQREATALRMRVVPIPDVPGLLPALTHAQAESGDLRIPIIDLPERGRLLLGVNGEDVFNALGLEWGRRGTTERRRKK